MIGFVVASVALVAWIYLLLGRGGFWRSNVTDEAIAGARGLPHDNEGPPPAVAAIMPARNEHETVGRAVTAVIAQTYKGPLSLIVVDDQSTDGTAAAAQAAAEDCKASRRTVVLSGGPLPPGWTGKLWAMQQGLQHATERGTSPDYILFVDADIVLGPDVVHRLVDLAERRRTALVSLMAKLRCESLPERMLIPAFVFFFQKLYPFSWVNRADCPTAGAAGGCMLVRRAALEDAGGLRAIRSALIDDCALARLLKRQGPIWLGLSRDVVSLRPYPGFNDIRRMVTRTAFAQLGYSHWQLAAAVLAMSVAYLAPPIAAFAGHGATQFVGAAAWALMAFMFLPTLRSYGVSLLWAPALPLIAALYTAFTLESAAQSWRGHGGSWKGRFQSIPIRGHHSP